MALSQVLEISNLVDSSRIDGETVACFLRKRGLEQIIVEHIDGPKSWTDFIQIRIKGNAPKGTSKPIPTLGIVGLLGGFGTRPKYLGSVSDADGGIAALACALKLADMQKQGDFLPGDVIISTHVTPCAPTRTHYPADFTDCPVDRAYLRKREIHEDMEVVLAFETARANRVVSHKGIALTPTILQGYILKVSNSLLDIYENVTGRNAVIVPITTQDITPQMNGLHHLNGTGQPAIYTNAPVVGISFTTISIVAGSAPGASQPLDVELGVRFGIEVGKALTKGLDLFYDVEEFDKILSYYGPLKHLTTMGKAKVTTAG